MSEMLANASQTAAAAAADAASAEAEWLALEWLYFFRLQSLGCLITSLFWMLSPSRSLAPFRNPTRRPPSEGEMAGLQLGGISLFAFSFCLARVVWTRNHPFRTSILYFQEAATLADVLLVLSFLYMLFFSDLRFSKGLILIQNLLAIFTAIIIVGFLSEQGHVDNYFVVPDCVHTHQPQWLSTGWLYYYRCKSVVCMITALTWMFKPSHAIAAYSEKKDPNNTEAVSFQMGGISLFCFAFFLARLTWTTYQPDKLSLLHFQEAATSSDVMILLSSLYVIFSKRFHYDKKLMAIQLTSTIIFTCVGVTFLVIQNHVEIPFAIITVILSFAAYTARTWLKQKTLDSWQSLWSVPLIALSHGLADKRVTPEDQNAFRQHRPSYMVDIGGASNPSQRRKSQQVDSLPAEFQEASR